MKKIGLVLGSGWTYKNNDVRIIPRTHLYEGLGIDAVADPIRQAKYFGVEILILTNAAGSIQHKPGQVCLISDHINLTGQSPLTGKNFVDMSDTYSKRLRQIVQTIEPLPEEIYAQFRGPQYETPAEVRMAGSFGADLMGMSTALETIVAKEQGMEVLGLSLVTNQAAGISPTRLDHDEVLAIGDMSHEYLNRLLTRIIEAIR